MKMIEDILTIQALSRLLRGLFAAKFLRVIPFTSYLLLSTNVAKRDRYFDLIFICELCHVLNGGASFRFNRC